MAIETPSISRPLNPAASLNYEQLYLEGIKHIEALSGKLWTDYNPHDPGITILEILSYAITELGYRCDFAMGDIVEPPAEAKILNDFFSLANAGSNAPLTISDFRKLLIDLEDIRNAWLEKVIYTLPENLSDVNWADINDPNAKLFLHRGSNSGYLNNGLIANAVQGKLIAIKGLYDVFLQFENHPEFGDLNDNSMEAKFSFTLPGNTSPDDFLFDIEFPGWESLPMDILKDWIGFDPLGASAFPLVPGAHPGGGTPEYLNVTVQSFVEVTGQPFTYKANLKIESEVGSGEFWYPELVIRLKGEHVLIVNELNFLNNVRAQINGQQFNSTTPGPFIELLLNFLRRMYVILEKLQTAAGKLASHRNLCEDFLNVYPMSLQEIGLDLNLDLEQGTDCVEVLAQVYLLTEEYLSPNIRFHSLREMLEKGYKPEEVFRGPWLHNGFIDQNDLSFYQQREILYTSDLVQEFMKIKGVKAVNYIAFSRFEQGLTAVLDGVEQKKLTECLCLKNPSRFLPKLNYDFSSIRMTCGAGKASEPNQEDALSLLSELKAIDRLKGKAEQGDFAIPKGEYANLAEYSSIQHEFPAYYAIGIEGLSSEESVLRHAQAKQMKGYLLFFEQLLGNFLSQLENLRQLFSYSPDIDRTYFTQALVEIPRVKELIQDWEDNYPLLGAEAYLALNLDDPSYFPNRLDAIAEDEMTFLDRRKRFLDHLMGRFNESFTEYAAYVYGKGITKAEKLGILIEDQSRFLRNYVMHSHDRGTGFNYQLNPVGPFFNYWGADYALESLNSPENTGSLNPEAPQNVDPFEEFEIYQDNSSNFRFRIFSPNGTNMFYSNGSFPDLETCQAAIMAALEAGKDAANYDTSSPVLLYGNPSFTGPVLGRVGAAYVNEHNNATEAAQALAVYFDNLLEVDEMAEENTEGLSIWFADNEVTGIKKRMTFLAGLPNVNRQWVNPFARFNITGSLGAYEYELLDAAGEVIFTYAGTGFATEMDAILAIQSMMEALVADELEILGTDILNNPTSATEYGNFSPDYVAQFADATALLQGIKEYVQSLYEVENLHVVEHILLRQRETGNPTLKVRIDDECPALDIEDPYSFRVSVMLPLWAGKFKEQSYRSMFKRLMRAEVPAHVYIHFMWLDPVQMYKFEKCWAQWLAGGWQTPNEPCSICSGNSDDGVALSFIDCFNQLCNLSDAQYQVEPPRIKDLYSECDVLAAPFDPDGEIVRAILVNGSSLPPGTCMDPCSGTIQVSDKDLFSNDETLDYNLFIQTINAGGEQVCHTITLSYIENGDATVTVLIPEQNQCAYVQAGVGAVIASSTDPDELAEATLSSWTLVGPTPMAGSITAPPGMYFETGAGLAVGSADIGKLTVTDPSLLLPGTYYFEVLLEDALGGETIVNFSFVIVANVPATATVAGPLNQDAYLDGNILATITDASAPGLVSVMDGGSVLAPLGLALDPVTMPAAAVNIVIANVSLFQSTLATAAWTLVAGYYQKTIVLQTTDPCGGANDVSILLRVKKDNEAYWTFSQSPSKNVSTYVNGAVLGRIQDPDGALVDEVLMTNANNAILSPAGLVLDYNVTSLVDAGKGLIKVANKTLFKNAINAAPANPSRIATINFTLQTKDVTGGLSNVLVTIQAKQDIAPIVTVYAARNVDTYTQGEVVATIQDLDGMGITSASHVSTGFSLASAGLAMRVISPYQSYPSGGQVLGNFSANRMVSPTPELRAGSSLASGSFSGLYQSLPQPLYPALPQAGYVEIYVQNVNVLRSAVNTPTHWVVIDTNTHLTQLDLTINTTDSQQGFASNLVQIKIIQDIEAQVVEYMNNERINQLQAGSLMVRFNDVDTNTQLQSASYTGFLPSAFTAFKGADNYSIYVVNEKGLTVGNWPITVTLIDTQGGETIIPITISVRPKLVKAIFAIESLHKTQMLNLDTKVSGLRMLSMDQPYLPKSFGSISIGNGSQVAFTEGSSFSTSNYPMTVTFKGLITKTNEPVDGELTISRKSKITKGGTGLTYLDGNTKLNKDALLGNAKLTAATAETGTMLRSLETVTYFGDNPNLRSNLELMTAYASGAKDAEVTAQLKSMSTASTNEVLVLKDALASNADRKTNSKSLEGHAELLRLQVMAAVHYAGYIRQEDLAAGSELDGLFNDFAIKMQSIFAGQSASTTLPELKSLRSTLLDLQDVYAATKPALQAAIDRLVTIMPVAELQALEAKLPSPTTAEVDAEMASLIQLVGNSFGEFETYWADPEFRLAWTEGQFFLGLANFPEISYLKSMEALVGYLQQNAIRIKELAYGTQLLDAQHNQTLGLDLFNLALGAWLGLVDLLPQELEGNRGLQQMMAEFGELVIPVTKVDGTTALRNLIARWIGFWTLRPTLVDALRAWVSVAELRMEVPKAVTQYKAGDVIASVLLAIGEINAVSITKGRLPKGMELKDDGRIVVSAPELLVDGIYGGLEISGANNKGFRFSLPVPDIYFAEDLPASYVVLPPVSIKEYYDGQSLAYPQDPDTAIDLVQFLAGKFPKGVRLDTETGEFTVANAAKLIEGAYPMQVMVVDVFGAETTHDFVLQIGLDGGGGPNGTPTIEFSKTDIPLPQDQGALLATITFGELGMKSYALVDGTLPLGTKLAQTGELTVGDSNSLHASTFVFTILAEFADGIKRNVIVTIGFVQTSNTVELSVLGILLPQPSGVVILNLGVEGEKFQLYEGVTGAFPPGLDIAPNGDIVVAQPESLKAGLYNFTVDGYTFTGVRYLFKVTIEFGTRQAVVVDLGTVRLPQKNGVEVGSLGNAAEVLVKTTILEGRVPAGMDLSQGGKMVISNSSVLAASSHQFLVEVVDDKNNITQKDVRLNIV